MTLKNSFYLVILINLLADNHSENSTIMKYFLIPVFFLLISFPLFAQQNLIHTMTFEQDSFSPEASLEDVAWIEGHWFGSAFDGIIEEVWTAPLGNSMMGVFKLVVEEKVQFYEILTISEEGGTLILRLKHFHNDLKGWEEKDESVDFPLVKMSEDNVFFDRFTFEYKSENEMNVYVLLDNEHGTYEHKFVYTKKD